ncbi:MAG: APC family permease [Tepidisphaeraceae bacterium]
MTDTPDHLPASSAPALECGRAQPTLARNMGLFALVVYGVGDMVGSGVYATIGTAAGKMGNAVWLAFAVSMVAAMLTGMSYACISSRYPRAAGAAYVTHRAFRIGFLSYLVGLAVTASGLTSMATSSNAFARTLRELLRSAALGIDVPLWVIIVGFLALLTFLNFWGIRESMWGNLVCTLIEVGGLLLVIIVGAKYWGSVDYFEFPPRADERGQTPLGTTGLVMAGAVLTFFSFVGFEDMLNVAEEVRDPVRTCPRGIMIAIAVTTVLYIGISVTAVSVVNYRELSDFGRGAPLEQITRRAAPWLPGNTYTFITMFAVANTALINFIMGSRLIYGMSRHGLMPAALGRVHPWRRTPHVAIGVLSVVVLVLALLGNIGDLAAATSLLLLGCFVIVNTALVVLKRRPSEPRGAFEVPTVVPVLGALVCAALIVARLLERDAGGEWNWKAPAIAAGVGVGIAVIYLVHRPKAITEDELVVEVEGGVNGARR